MKAIQPSKPVVVPASTPTDKKPYSVEDKAKCMSCLLIALSHETISKDKWFLAMSAAQELAADANIENREIIFKDLAEMIIKRRSNSFTGLMERSGFL